MGYARRHFCSHLLRPVSWRSFRATCASARHWPELTLGHCLPRTRRSLRVPHVGVVVYSSPSRSLAHSIAVRINLSRSGWPPGPWFCLPFVVTRHPPEQPVDRPKPRVAIAVLAPSRLSSTSCSSSNQRFRHLRQPAAALEWLRPLAAMVYVATMDALALLGTLVPCWRLPLHA